MHQVLARKWRPKTFDQLLGQEHVCRALIYALDHQRLHHAYLFSGTRGVGKTTIARILAKSLNCLTNGVSSQPCGSCDHCREIDEGRFPDLIEVDAASRTKVDETRELLENVAYAPVKGAFKIYLIDEVHMFSRSSFNALLKTLEEPPPHVHFILATTDPQKLPVTVLSRCLQFHLKKIPAAVIAAHLGDILQAEHIDYEEEGLRLLAEAGAGSMRDALSLLDQAIVFGNGKVSSEDTARMLGAVPQEQLLELLQSLLEGQAAAMRRALLRIDQYAPDYLMLCQRLIGLVHEMCWIQLQGDAQSAPALQHMAQQLQPEMLQLWYDILMQTQQNLAWVSDEYTTMEMALLRILAFRPVAFRHAEVRSDDVPVMMNANVTATTANAALKPLSADPSFSAVSESLDEQSEDLSPEASAQEHEPVAAMPHEEQNVAQTLKQHSEQQKKDDDVAPVSAPTVHNVPSVSEQETQNSAMIFQEVLQQVAHWSDWIEALQLPSAASVLAKNTLPSEWQEPVLTLDIEEKYQSMVTEHTRHVLQEALAQKVQFPNLLIHFRSVDQVHTPFIERQQHEQHERNAQQEAFLSHPVVQKLQKVLKTEVDLNSIHSIEGNSSNDPSVHS